MFVTVLCLSLAASVAADRTLAERLLTGVEQWQTKVSFRSTFRLRAGFARTLAQGLRGQIDPKIKGHPSNVFEASGVSHKLGSKVRYSEFVN